MKTIKQTITDEPTLLALLAIILAVAALWAVGCGGGGGAYATPTTPSGGSSTPATPSGSSTAANVTVNIVGSAGSTAFSPNPAPASTGQTVAFKNNDGTLHHLVADNGTWDSGDILAGATSKTLTVTSGSALNFHCTIHPTMVGTINGATAPPPPTVDDTGAYDYDY